MLINFFFSPEGCIVTLLVENSIFIFSLIYLTFATSTYSPLCSWILLNVWLFKTPTFLLEWVYRNNCYRFDNRCGNFCVWKVVWLIASIRFSPLSTSVSGDKSYWTAWRRFSLILECISAVAWAKLFIYLNIFVIIYLGVINLIVME